MAADPLERLWALLFTGDGPDNRVLQTDSRGRCTVVEFRGPGVAVDRVHRHREHGPKAQLVAIPPELNTRSIAAAEALEDSLDRSVETLVAQVRTADLEHLAQQLRTTAQGR